MEYVVVVEKGPASFGAYVPDLPGCIAVGDTREEVLTLIREAIEFHIEGLREDGVCQSPNRKLRPKARFLSPPKCARNLGSALVPSSNGMRVTIRLSFAGLGGIPRRTYTKPCSVTGSRRPQPV